MLPAFEECERFQNSPPIGVASTGCLRAALLLLLFFMLASLAMPLLLGAFIQLMSQ